MVVKVKRITKNKSLSSGEHDSAKREDKYEMEMAIAYAEDNEYCELIKSRIRLRFWFFISVFPVLITFIAGFILMNVFKNHCFIFICIPFVIIAYLLEETLSKNQLALLMCKSRINDKRCDKSN